MSREADEMTEAAVTVARENVRPRPDDANLHMVLAFALDILGVHEEAADEVRMPIRLNPESAQAHQFLGGMLAEC
jgi:Flp pilus assembly protein TadD